LRRGIGGTNIGAVDDRRSNVGELVALCWE
jgi:hypothetical protein